MLASVGRTMLLAIALLVALAAPAPAADDEVAAARKTFRAIVQEVVTDPRVPRGRSLTGLVHDLTSHPADVVRAAESKEWSAPASSEIAYRFAMEQTIRFLHGLPDRKYDGEIEFGESSGFDADSGAVLLRRNSGASHGGPGMEVFNGSLHTLVGKAPPRRFPFPTAGALLGTQVDEGDGRDTPRWSDSALLDFGMALGEACAADDAGFARLLERAAKRPFERHVLFALGWSRRPEAAERLTQTILDLAGRSSGRGDSCRPSPMDDAVAALGHADANAFARLTAGLTDEQSWFVLGTPRPSAILRQRLADVRGAAAPDDRRAAILRLCATSRTLRRVPHGEDAPRFLGLLVECADGGDAALRAAALSTAGGIFGEPAAETQAYERLGGLRGECRVEGRSLGALAGAEASLRRLLADVEAGDVAVVEEMLPEAQRAPLVPGWSPARSDAKQRPDLGFSHDDDGVRVSAEWTDRGLRLRFVHEGKEAVAVNPVALRYGIAHRVVETSRVGTAPPVSEPRFRIQLGVAGLHGRVPPGRLVVLRPGATYTCEIPLLPEFRGEKTLDIDLGWSWTFTVAAPSSVPVLRFRCTRVL